MLLHWKTQNAVLTLDIFMGGQEQIWKNNNVFQFIKNHMRKKKPKTNPTKQYNIHCCMQNEKSSIFN